MNRRRVGKTITFCLSLCLVAVFLVCLLPYLGGGSSAGAEAKKACVTDNCHSKVGKEKYVHGPAATGDCVYCHEVLGEKRRGSKSNCVYDFKPIADVTAQCYKCHDRVDLGKKVHAPIKESKCTGCHDPHQSPYEFQLRGAGSELCFNCHKKAMVAKKYVHGPVAVGGCSVCHNPHTSDFPKLLKATGNDVCYACHTDKVEAFQGKKFIHKPVKESCIKCHDPHAGDYEFNFAKSGLEGLCFECHADKKEYLEKITVKHGGLETEKRCIVCHDPHVSNYVKQLVAQPVDLCNSCHDREYVKGNYKVINTKELLENNKIHHGPIKEKDCSACHNTHGSKNFRMLRAYFPQVFYSGYNVENYAVCFMCHENTLAQDPETDKLTGFRNGKQNLHFVHVNKKIKGRTCRACHDAHATNNPRHVRDAVPFGAWALPVGFKKTENGGTCLPGCHQLFEYNRNKPVANR